jgi:hypothetical protein
MRTHSHPSYNSLPTVPRGRARITSDAKGVLFATPEQATEHEFQES